MCVNVWMCIWIGVVRMKDRLEAFCRREYLKLLELTSEWRPPRHRGWNIFGIILNIERHFNLRQLTSAFTYDLLKN